MIAYHYIEGPKYLLYIPCSAMQRWEAGYRRRHQETDFTFANPSLSKPE
jgi:hypothetical protein